MLKFFRSRLRRCKPDTLRDLICGTIGFLVAALLYEAIWAVHVPMVVDKQVKVKADEKLRKPPGFFVLENPPMPRLVEDRTTE